jgi:hypothetical protein
LGKIVQFSLDNQVIAVTIPYRKRRKIIRRALRK